MQCPREIDGVRQCDTWGNVSSYPYEGRRILNQDWDHCPARPLQDMRLVVAVSYFRASKVSPLEGWPDTYAAWVERVVMELDYAVQSRKVEEVNRGSR